jgi:dephospho-CoA kinase
MPGAGKSTAGQALESLGALRIVMGDIIREETKRRGLQPNQENTGKVMRELREKFGEAAVAELCLQKILASGERFVMVDGIRSVAEAEAFRKAGDFLLVAIHASRQRRFHLLKERGRSDDPILWDAFISRDERELGIGLGRAIALADEVVSNEHSTPEDLGRTVVTLVKGWRQSLAK